MGYAKNIHHSLHLRSVFPREVVEQNAPIFELFQAGILARGLKETRDLEALQLVVIMQPKKAEEFNHHNLYTEYASQCSVYILLLYRSYVPRGPVKIISN